MTQRKNGFTLIELLIVVLIISIVASVAVLSIRQNVSKQVEQTAQQIVNLLNLTETEALLRSATLGVKVSATRLTFYEFKGDKTPQWHVIHQGNLKPFSLPKHVSIQLKNKNADDTKKKLVDITFFPSSDITPFILELKAKNKPPSWRIKGLHNGTLISETIHEE